MTPRLMKISSLVDSGASVIDVGCDHGYVPIYLASEGIISKALATDVNEGPLLSANKNIHKYGFDDIVKTKLSNGLLNVDCEEYDTIIIAGMGGVLISEILKANIRGKTYILQPMTALDYLMEFLADNGFKVTEHLLVEEDNHIYNILKVTDGAEKLEDIDLFLGKNIAKDELYFKYAKVLESKFKKIINGLKKSQNPSEEMITRYEKLCRKLEERVRN